KYSRGWKPGHFNANTLRSTQSVSAVRPETINSYEAGIRTQWFDGLLTANLTAFKYAYQDLQVFQVTVDPVGFVLRRLINAQEADIWGLEWELSAEPIEGLFLGFNGGYLNSSYTIFSVEFERSKLVQGEGRQIYYVDVDYSGNRLIASPPWSFTLTAEYMLTLDKVGAIRPRMTVAYKGPVFFDPNEGCGAEGNVPQCLLQQPSIFLLNGSLTWTSSNDRVEVTAFVRNMLNEQYKVQAFDLSSRRQLMLSVYGVPRMAGAIITLRY
ncbi:TonB-dependent receptor, partial [Myxococcota bacterium]|nr:TonB-dependent receptor [Myxococcota bacterium]